MISHYVSKLRFGDGSLAQDFPISIRYTHNTRRRANCRRPAIEDKPDSLIKSSRNLTRVARGPLAREVGARRNKHSPGSLGQIAGNRMVGNSQSNPTSAFTANNQSQRPRPESSRKTSRPVWQVAAQIAHLAYTAKEQLEGLPGAAALCARQSLHGASRAIGGAEAIDRFSRKSHDPVRIQNRSRLSNGAAFSGESNWQHWRPLRIHALHTKQTATETEVPAAVLIR
jgi:hypothetical protein